MKLLTLVDFTVIHTTLLSKSGLTGLEDFQDNEGFPINRAYEVPFHKSASREMSGSVDP